MDQQNYAKEVEELLKLPPNLCRQCGQCCRVSIFRNGYKLEEIKALIEDKNAKESWVKGAKDFLSVFLPISFEEAQRLNYKFTVDIMKKLNKTKDDITFFSCRHLTDDNKCLIHDKRPDFCRHYPACYKDMYYFDNCGYKEQLQKNWKRVEEILAVLGIKDI